MGLPPPPPRPRPHRAARGYLKGVALHGADDVPEEDLGGQGVAVVDDGLRVRPVPAVDLQTAAASPQGAVCV